MEITYAPGYKIGDTRYLVIHNTGGLGDSRYASTQQLLVHDVDKAHKERFNMLSSMGWWVGYNFYIDEIGVITQCRAVGEETAAQRGYNYGGIAISVCLAGNFTKRGTDIIDEPTPRQIAALKELYTVLPKIPAANIVPHRFLQNTTSCYGYMSNDWARNILGPINDEYISKIRELIATLTYLLAEAQRRAGLGFGLLKGFVQNCDCIDSQG